MTSWQTANDLPGGSDCDTEALRAEVERLRTEAARLLALFAEAKAHPASAWWYVEQALGGDPLPRRASLVTQPDGSHAPQH